MAKQTSQAAFGARKPRCSSQQKRTNHLKHWRPPAHAQLAGWAWRGESYCKYWQYSAVCAAQTFPVLNCSVRSRWSATFFVYPGFNVSQAMPTLRDGYWNNSLIKTVSSPSAQGSRSAPRMWHGRGNTSLCLHCSSQEGPLLSFLCASSLLSWCSARVAVLRHAPSHTPFQFRFWPVEVMKSRTTKADRAQLAIGDLLSWHMPPASGMLRRTPVPG